MTGLLSLVASQPVALPRATADVTLTSGLCSRSYRARFCDGCPPRTSCWVRSRTRKTFDGRFCAVSRELCTLPSGTQHCGSSSQLSCRCGQGDPQGLCIKFFYAGLTTFCPIQAGGGAVKSLATAAGNGLQYAQQVSEADCICHMHHN